MFSPCHFHCFTTSFLLIILEPESGLVSPFNTLAHGGKRPGTSLKMRHAAFKLEMFSFNTPKHPFCYIPATFYMLCAVETWNSHGNWTSSAAERPIPGLSGMIKHTSTFLRMVRFWGSTNSHQAIFPHRWHLPQLIILPASALFLTQKGALLP